MGDRENANMNVLTTGEARTRAQRLTTAANELLSLAQELDPEHTHPPQPLFDRPDGRSLGDRPTLEHVARHMYHQRRRRREFFGAKLFGEPAWDLLLDLYIAAREDKRVSVTSACIAADVPSTTALRWIGVLEKEGLVIRENDVADARRIFIRLTDDGSARMAQFLSGVLLRFGMMTGATSRRRPRSAAGASLLHQIFTRFSGGR